MALQSTNRHALSPDRSTERREGAPAVVAPICKLCSRAEFVEETLHFILRPKELNEAKAGECKFCALVHQIISHVLDEDLVWDYCVVELGLDGLSSSTTKREFNKPWEFKNFYQYPICSLRLTVKTKGLFGLEKAICVSRIQDASAEKSLPWIKLERIPEVVVEGTSSESAVSWAKAQLAKCIGHHEVCQRANRSGVEEQNRFFPKRLLDLRGKSDVRLREVNEHEDGISGYACLSHCWGQHPETMFKTESGTLEQFKRRINLDQLPRIFRDAISFLRRLNIEYLWIDSLCIVQASVDSPGDWSEECAKMGDIYSNAVLTIAATRAKDGSDALFSPIAIPIPIDWEGVHWLIREEARKFLRGLFLGEETVRIMEASFPLLGRAWVTQEMMLSPRVLHFCEGDIVWECMQDATCACPGEPMKLKDAIWAEQTKIFSQARLYDNENTSNPKNKGAFSLQSLIPNFHSWQNLVEYYCGLGLSYQKDRLPAISGLAGRFASIYRCTDAAGLWLENIHRDLLWHLAEPMDGRVSDDYLPTWSWAYAWHPVSFMQTWGQVETYISAVRLDSVPLSLYDPFGQPSSVKLTVTGYLMPLQYLDGRSEEANLKSYRASFDIPQNILQEKMAQGSNTVGLPVLGMDLETSYGIILGLALIRRQGNEYERVGVWEFTPYKEAKNLHEQIERSPKNTIVLV